MPIKFSDFLNNIKPSPMLRMYEAAGKYSDLTNLGIGEPDLDTDPRIIAAAAKGAADGFTKYPPVPGFQDLRAAISKYWYDRYKLESEADDVFVGVGGTQIIFMMMQALINPGDEVIVPQPCFSPYFQAIEYVYGKAVPVSTSEANGFNITAEELEKAITPKTKVVLLNSPCNPTGAVQTRQEALKICEVIKKHKLTLLSDEVYESFLYDGEHVCMASLPGMKERTVTIGSFSKTYAMCGFRIGYCIGPRALIDGCRMLNMTTVMGTNSLSQRAALYALENCQDFADKMRTVFKERVYYVADRINSIKGLSCVKPKGAFYVFANISQMGLSSLDFALKLLNEAKVVTIPGVGFGADGYVRFACTIPIEKMAPAFDRIEQLLSK